jgi:hypothetical protein
MPLNSLKLWDKPTKSVLYLPSPYPLGGPHVYTRLELYEMLMNYLEKYPKLVYLNKNVAKIIASKMYNWDHFNLERINKDNCDIYV